MHNNSNDDVTQLAIVADQSGNITDEFYKPSKPDEKIVPNFHKIL